MFINDRKLGYRGWTACLVLLAALTLVSCTKKADDPAAGNSPATSTTPAASTTPATSTAASKDKTATASSKAGSSTKKTLSPEAEKLGVKPKGADCPTNAPIKGNLNKKGNQIYHEPKAKEYKNVKPEICFADAATAQKAGFRAPNPKAAQ